MADDSPKAHPLIGKLISVDCDGGSAHTISQFTAEIADGLMLARRLNPRTGVAFAESHIIVLGQVAQNVATMIFDDWDACEQFYACSHEKERVVRLVPKPE